jgi:thiol-disulfide isomerase/thioredoxin
MKNTLFVFWAVLAVGCGGVPKDTFVIEGRVAGVPDSSMLTLDLREGRTLRAIDTAYVIGGCFSFHHPTTEKERLAIIGRSEIFPSMMLDMWAEPGQKAVIRGEDPLLYTWSIKSPITEQQETGYYIQNNKAGWNAYQRLIIEYYALFNKRSSATSDEELEQITRQSRLLRSQQDSIMYRIYDKELDLLAGAEPSGIFLNRLNELSGMIFHYKERYGDLRERAIAQYNRLADEQKASEQGLELTRCLYPPTAVETGGEMADAELPDLSGAIHKLSDYKGKYILLDFWSAGCGPCIMAMPELGEISKQYADRLTIVGISSDAHNVWSEATEKYNVTWVNLNAPGAQSEIAAKYKVGGIPHQVVISPEGIVLGAWTGYGEGYLREQLKKHIPGIE